MAVSVTHFSMLKRHFPQLKHCRKYTIFRTSFTKILLRQIFVFKWAQPDEVTWQEKKIDSNLYPQSILAHFYPFHIIHNVAILLLLIFLFKMMSIFILFLKNNSEYFSFSENIPVEYFAKLKKQLFWENIFKFLGNIIIQAYFACGIFGELLAPPPNVALELSQLKFFQTSF